MMANINNLLELPKGWVWTRLGEISSLAAGNPAPQGEEYFDNGIYPFVRVQDMGSLGNSVYIYDTRDHVNSKAIEKVRIFPKGSVLFTKSGMSILLNQRAILGRDMHIVSHIGVSMPLCGIPSEWLYYWLKTIDFKNLTHATTLPSLQLSKVQQIPILLPPLPEQQRIVAKIEELLTRLDAGVEALKKIEVQLGRYRQATLKYAFEGKLTKEWREFNKGELEPASVLMERIKEERKKDAKGKYKELPPVDTSDLPELPEGWIWASFEELAESERNAIKAGPFGSSLKKEFYVPQGYKIYGQEQVIREDPFYGNYYINEERYAKLKSCAVKPGDMLISLVGTIGKVLVLPEAIEPGIINPRLVKFSLEKRLVNNAYIKAYIESSAVRHFFSLSSHGGTMDILNLTILKILPIPLPPLPEQHKIVEEIERCFSVADEIERTVEQSLKQAERLRQSILKRAFEGKLVPQDPTDEPAEILLERIRAERARREVEKKATGKSRSKLNTRQGRLISYGK